MKCNAFTSVIISYRFNDETLYSEFVVVVKGTGELGKEEEAEEEEEGEEEKGAAKKTAAAAKKKSGAEAAKAQPTSGGSSKESGGSGVNAKTPPKSGQQQQPKTICVKYTPIPSSHSRSEDVGVEKIRETLELLVFQPGFGQVAIVKFDAAHRLASGNLHFRESELNKNLG